MLFIMVPDFIYSTIMVAVFGIRLMINKHELDNLREIHRTFHNLAQYNLVFYLLAVLVIFFEMITVRCAAATFFKFMFKYFYIAPQALGLINGWVFAYYALSKEVSKALSVDPEKTQNIYPDFKVMAWFRLSFPIIAILLLIILGLVQICPCCPKIIERDDGIIQSDEDTEKNLDLWQDIKKPPAVEISME